MNITATPPHPVTLPPDDVVTPAESDEAAESEFGPCDCASGEPPQPIYHEQQVAFEDGDARFGSAEGE